MMMSPQQRVLVARDRDEDIRRTLIIHADHRAILTSRYIPLR